MKDLYHDLKAEHSLLPAAQAGAAEGDAIIDLQGFEGALIVCYVGTITGNTTFELQEGDEDDLSDDEAVADIDLLGLEPTFLFATECDMVKTFGYRGSKRYIRVDVTAGIGIAGALVVKGFPRHAPVV
jgi:hypothetical protein